jgi:hypothetical protein
MDNTAENCAEEFQNISQGDVKILDRMMAEYWTRGLQNIGQDHYRILDRMTVQIMARRTVTNDQEGSRI